MFLRYIKKLIRDRINKHIVEIDISEQIEEKAKELLMSELGRIRLNHEYYYGGASSRYLDLRELIDEALKNEAEEQLSDVNLHRKIERYIEANLDSSVDRYLYSAMEKRLEPLLQEKSTIKSIIEEINDYQVTKGV